MDDEVRRLDALAMLGVAGSLNEIGALWDRVGKRFADGSFVSADAALMACAAEFPGSGRVTYVAGAPCSGTQAPPEGFDRFEVPGGRYALVHHRGPYSGLASIPAPLRSALDAVGEQPTDRWLELYRPLGPNGETHVEIGVLLAEVARPRPPSSPARP